MTCRGIHHCMHTRQYFRVFQTIQFRFTHDFRLFFYNAFSSFAQTLLYLERQRTYPHKPSYKNFTPVYHWSNLSTFAAILRTPIFVIKYSKQYKQAGFLRIAPNLD